MRSSMHPTHIGGGGGGGGGDDGHVSCSCTNKEKATFVLSSHVTDTFNLSSEDLRCSALKH